MYKKTKLCTYHYSKRCNNNNCTFAHSCNDVVNPDRAVSSLILDINKKNNIQEKLYIVSTIRDNIDMDIKNLKIDLVVLESKLDHLLSSIVNIIEKK